MRKVLSLLLTVVILCTMVSVPVFAATDYTVVKNFFSTDTGAANISNGTVTTVSGIMGRGADDKST